MNVPVMATGENNTLAAWVAVSILVHSMMLASPHRLESTVATAPFSGAAPLQVSLTRPLPGAEPTHAAEAGDSVSNPAPDREAIEEVAELSRHHREEPASRLQRQVTPRDAPLGAAGPRKRAGSAG